MAYRRKKPARKNKRYSKKRSTGRRAGGRRGGGGRAYSVGRPHKSSGFPPNTPEDIAFHAGHALWRFKLRSEHAVAREKAITAAITQFNGWVPHVTEGLTASHLMANTRLPAHTAALSVMHGAGLFKK